MDGGGKWTQLKGQIDINIPSNWKLKCVPVPVHMHVSVCVHASVCDVSDLPSPLVF